MAIALDARSAATPVNAASITWSHTVGAGSNMILVVGVSTGSGTIKTISTVSWNGSTTGWSGTVNGVATQEDDAAASPNVNANLWYLLAPAAGTFNIVVTPNASCELMAGAISLSGVNQADPFNAASPHKARFGSSPAQPTQDVTSANGEWCIDCVGVNLAGASGDGVPGANQVQIFEGYNGSATSGGLGSDEAATGATTTMDWTGITGHAATAQTAISLKPASGGVTGMYWVRA